MECYHLWNSMDLSIHPYTTLQVVITNVRGNLTTPVFLFQLYDRKLTLMKTLGVSEAQEETHKAFLEALAGSNLAKERGEYFAEIATMSEQSA